MTINGKPAADAGPEPLMTVSELAAYLRVPRTTVYAWNYTRTGPTPIHVGRFVRYRRQAVEEWLEERSHGDA